MISDMGCRKIAKVLTFETSNSNINQNTVSGFTVYGHIVHFKYVLSPLKELRSYGFLGIRWPRYEGIVVFNIKVMAIHTLTNVCA